MEFTASPADVIRAVDTARSIEGNPLRLAGRFLGLSGEEQDGGIPRWTWALLGVGVVAAVGYRFWPRDGIRAFR